MGTNNHSKLLEIIFECQMDAYMAANHAQYTKAHDRMLLAELLLTNLEAAEKALKKDVD